MATSSDGRSKRGRGGQAMVESLIVLLVTCLLLFALMQVAHAFAHREIMRHAAARAARARTVGFNSWMCRKVMRAAAIPASGKMLQPDDAGDFDDALADASSRLRHGALWDWAVAAEPGSGRAAFEVARIPDYLASENGERAEQILDYEGWDSISATGLGGSAGSPPGRKGKSKVSLSKVYPLSIFVTMLCDWVGITPGGTDGPKELNLKGDFEIESHYPLYIDDNGW